MRMRIFGQKIITAGLLIGLLTWLFLLPEGFVDDAVGCFPPPCLTCPPCWTGCYCNHYNPGCPTCDSSKCLCCRDCQCYFQCPYDKACIVEITGHDLCYEGCHYNTIGTGSMNGTYTLQPYGDECDWGAVYPSNLTLTLFYDVNHPYCPNPPNTEPCTCVYLPSAPGILVFHFHCWGSSAFLYIYDINPINPDTEEGDEIFRGGTNSVTNCIECTISDSNPVFCPNGHWASPTAKITVNSDPTCVCAPYCNTALCQTCVGGQCKACGGDTNKKCCYPEDGINHCCKSSETCCNGSCCDTEGCPTCPPTGLSVTLNVNPIESTHSSQCSGCGSGYCGTGGPPENIDVDIPMPCFASCKWKFGVSATADYCYGPCFSGYINIDSGWSTYLTTLNYIYIVESFRYGTGCAGTGGLIYSNTECLWIHESYHLQEFLTNIETEQQNLQYNPALSDMDCPGEADSCQAAYDARAGEIRDAVERAYNNAWNCNEAGGQMAARPCFTAVADSICENWYCGE